MELDVTATSRLNVAAAENKSDEGAAPNDDPQITMVADIMEAEKLIWERLSSGDDLALRWETERCLELLNEGLWRADAERVSMGTMFLSLFSTTAFEWGV